MSIVSYEYAKALFDLALEQEDKNIILDFEKKFNDVVEACKQEPKFMKLMLTPSVGDKEKKELVKEIFHTTQNTFEHFLYVLIDNKRIEMIDEIMIQYKDIVTEYNKELEVLVTSSVSLTDCQKEKLAKKLSDKYNKKIKIVNEVDSTLIGGIKIEVNNDTLDLSLKTKIKALEKNLIE